jgi:bacteriocin biosynthesis cyclodehydratase domain-containing protein
MSVLRLKPHLAAHVVSPQEVALLGEGGRFALHGTVYAAVLPLLDGKRSDDVIVARLSGRFSPELVYYALGELEAKGYVLPAAPGKGDAVGDAWWSGHNVAPEAVRRSSLSRTTRLVDAGAHRPALAALRVALGSGRSAPRTGPHDLVVIATGDYLDDRLATEIRKALPNTRQVLPVRLAGASIWVGPLLDTKTAGLFKVLTRRLAANRPADVAARARGATFPLLPAQGLPVTFDLAAAWIASAALAITAGTPPPFLPEGVITLDPWTLETTRHPISIASTKPMGRAKRGRTAPIELASAPKRFTADGGHRTCAPSESLARLERLVSPIAGIVPNIEKMPMLADMHVYQCMQLYEGGHIDPRANRVLGRPGGAGGKGASDLQARASCLAEAVERYSCGYVGDEKRRRARISEAGETAVDPRELLMFSDAQYRDREATNRAQGKSFNWVPEPFDPGRAIDWSPAWSLTHGREVWLPSVFCYFGYRPERNHDFCQADSNGCAAGNTLEEAIQQGFLELVERDACALWWYNRVRRPGVDLSSFDDPFFSAMSETFDAGGRELVVLDVTSDLGIPTVMAISWRRSDGGRIHLGLGCHLEPRLAISRALAELNQSAGLELGGGEDAPSVGFDPTHKRWLMEATIGNQPYLRPAEGAQRTAADFIDRSTRDVRDDLLVAIEALRQKGLEMIVLDHTRPDIGFPVARVVVPGLRHFWARNAPGRLYDVPVRLGWLDQPLREADLNLIPFFL